MEQLSAAGPPFSSTGCPGRRPRRRLPSPALSARIDVRVWRLKDTGYDASSSSAADAENGLLPGFKQSRFRYEEFGDESFRFAERLNRDETAVTLTFEAARLPTPVLPRRRGRPGRFRAARQPARRPVFSRRVRRIRVFGPRPRPRPPPPRLEAFRPREEGPSDYKRLGRRAHVSVSLLRPRPPARPTAATSASRSARPALLHRGHGRRRDFALCFPPPHPSRLRLIPDQVRLSRCRRGRRRGALSPPAGTGSATNTVGFFVRVGGNVGLGLRAGRYDRRTSAAGWKASREFVGLNLTYEFQ